MDLPLEFRDERELRSVLGTSLMAFNILLAEFELVLEAHYEERYQKQVADGTRKRKRGGGRTSALPKAIDKLIYGLYYLKNYPKFDVLVNTFGISRSVSNVQVHFIVPLIKKSLANLQVLPQREFESSEEFKKFLKDNELETLIMDATEREHFRYNEKISRDALFSGKKKVHYEKYSHL